MAPTSSPNAKRVIFVDDEPLVLEGIERLFFDQADTWELAFVDGGEQALREIAANGADVVVTDMRMPGMGGAELLEHLHREHPGAARLVLSGQSDTSALLRALPIAHEFLAKPCRGETLVATVTRALDVHATLTDPTLRAIAGRARTLPARPAVFDRLTRMLTLESTTLASLAAVLSEDVVLSARVLRVANSPLLSRGARCVRVPDAVARMGGDMLRALVLGIELSEASRTIGRDVEAIHRHSVEVGFVAGKLCDARLADEAMIAGMLHDIGKLVMLQVVEPSVRAALMCEGAAADALERDLCGASHATVGAYLVGLWGMSYPIVDAIARHDEPLAEIPATLDVGMAVRVAAALLEGRTLDDRRWSTWRALAEEVRAGAPEL